MKYVSLLSIITIANIHTYGAIPTVHHKRQLRVTAFVESPPGSNLMQLTYICDTKSPCRVDDTHSSFTQEYRSECNEKECWLIPDPLQNTTSNNTPVKQYTCNAKQDSECLTLFPLFDKSVEVPKGSGIPDEWRDKDMIRLSPGETVWHKFILVYLSYRRTVS